MRAFPRVSQSQLKYFQKLTSKKYREQEQKFLVEGYKLVEEALFSDWKVETLLLHREFLVHEKAGEILRRAEALQCEFLEISRDELRRLSDTVTAQSVIGVVVSKQPGLDSLFSQGTGIRLIVALDEVSDPGNAGSILRTCDWFGVHAVLLNKNSVELYNPKVVRSAMGSVFHVPVYSNTDLCSLVRKGKESGFRVYATTVGSGSNLQSLSFPEKTIIVFGSEAHGVSQEILQLADASMTIPKYGKAESLNVGVACGLVLGFWRAASERNA